jgi:hypothetical protein
MTFTRRTSVDLVIEKLEATPTLESSELASGFGRTLGSEWGSIQPEDEPSKIGMALLDPVFRADFLALKFISLAQQHSKLENQLISDQQSKLFNETKKRKWSMHDVATVAFYIGLIACLVAVGTFSTQRYELDPDSPDPVAVHSSWWGLVTERFRLRYMKEGLGDDATWCAESANKQWLPYFRLDDTRFEDDFEY